MSNEFKVGDLVTFKKSPAIKTDFYFIWDEIGNGEMKEFIVNVRPEIALTLRLELLDKSQNPRLFQLFDYVKVKPYELLKRIPTDLPDWEFLSWIISNRTEKVYMMEMIFSFLLQSQKDFLIFDDIYIESILPAIVNDKYCFFDDDDKKLFNQDKLSPLIQWMLKPALAQSKRFWVIKRMKNIPSIAQHIITEDGRPLLKKLKDDYTLLDTLVDLLNNKDSYATTSYTPFKTSQDKTIVHSISESYFQLFEKEAKAYGANNNEAKQEFENLKKKEPGLNLENLNYYKYRECIYEGVCPEFQQSLFTSLGTEIPVKKTVNGKFSLDYNLAFYIPAFKYLIPEHFVDNPKLPVPDQRRHHIRRIKDFIAGKI